LAPNESNIHLSAGALEQDEWLISKEVGHTFPFLAPKGRNAEKPFVNRTFSFFFDGLPPFSGV
jgi:hypothetical protein